MRVAAVIVLVAALVMPATAATNATDEAAPNTTLKEATIAELFRAFDLFGTWAADCGRPPAPDNPHVGVIEQSPGLLFEMHDVGPDYVANRYSVLSARRVAADRLEVEVIFLPGEQGEERQTLVMRVRDGTRRTIFNQPEGGAVRVKDGVALANGSKTPLLKKCG